MSKRIKPYENPDCSYFKRLVNDTKLGTTQLVVVCVCNVHGVVDRIPADECKGWSEKTWMEYFAPLRELHERLVFHLKINGLDNAKYGYEGLVFHCGNQPFIVQDDCFHSGI